MLGTLSPGLASKPDDLRAYFKPAVAAKFQVKLGDHSALVLSNDAVAIVGFYDLSQTGADGKPIVTIDRNVAERWTPRRQPGRRWLTS